MIEYFKNAFADIFFYRIVMFIWSIPFISILIVGIVKFQELQPDYWLFLFPVVLGLIGFWLLYTSVLAPDEVMDKRLSAVSDGADLAGVVLVLLAIVIALPIWAIKNAITKN